VDGTLTLGGVASLRPLFEPDHVAVIGASRTATKHGYRAATSLLAHGFQGRISLINPSGGEVAGIPFLPSIADAPGRVDCAIVLIPAEQAVEAIRECAAAGVRSLVVAIVGFAELGTDEGRRRQDEITAIVRAHGMRMIGPNTNGIFNGSHHLSLGSNTSHGEPMESGAISVVSHSGALFNHFARRLRQYGAGLSKFVPVGNEADVDMLDVLEYFIEDDASRVIGMIIEGIHDGARFRTLVERARGAGKPVAVLKLGRSRSGAKSSLAHSSRLAGDARAYDALFRACSVARVPTIEALAGGCAILAGLPAAPLPDSRLVCLANSGAACSMLADLAEEYAIPLAVDDQFEWDPLVAAALSEIPTMAPLRNPIDTGTFGGKNLLGDVFGALERSGVTGPTIAFLHTVLSNNKVANEANALIAHKERTSSPTIVVTPGGLDEAVMERYTSSGIPVFRDTITLFDSLQCYYATRPPAAIAAPANGASPSTGLVRAGAFLEAAAASGKSLLSELESSEILRSAGVPMVPSTVAGSAADAVAAAQSSGFPVVLKALAPDVAHKNQLGFVVTGIPSEDALQREWSALEARVLAAGFEPPHVTFIVQPMFAAKTELIVGVSRQEALGHFLVVGIGGIYTEVFDLVELVPIPSSATAIRAVIEGSPVGKLIASIATPDEPERPWNQVIGALEALQSLVLEYGERIESIDINPLLIGSRGCMAVDALVILTENSIA
jgi:acyl-CoA synthetase (NDP forming)